MNLLAISIELLRAIIEIVSQSFLLLILSLVKDALVSPRIAPMEATIIGMTSPLFTPQLRFEKSICIRLRLNFAKVRAHPFCARPGKLCVRHLYRAAQSYHGEVTPSDFVIPSILSFCTVAHGIAPRWPTSMFTTLASFTFNLAPITDTNGSTAHSRRARKEKKRKKKHQPSNFHLLHA